MQPSETGKRTFDLSPINSKTCSLKKMKEFFVFFFFLPILPNNCYFCKSGCTLMCLGISPCVLRDLLKGLATIPEFLCVKCLLWGPFTASVLYGPWSLPVCLSTLLFWRLFWRLLVFIAQDKIKGRRAAWWKKCTANFKAAKKVCTVNSQYSRGDVNRASEFYSQVNWLQCALEILF